MKKYTVVNAPLKLTAGVLQLSESQARDRKHNLEVLRGFGLYRIVKEVHFKVGESFGYDGDLSKSLAMRLELVDDAAAKKAAKEAEKQAAASAKKAAEEAWLNDEQLQTQYPEFDDYLKSLEGK